jgi:hypothetical protein
MPSANPFAPMVDIGGSASAGPATARGGFSLGTTGGVGDNHVSAGLVLLGLVALVLLWKNKFRFSTTVG